MNNITRGLVAICFSVASLALTPTSQSSTPPKSGENCSRSGMTANFQGKKYTCIKLGSKLYWDNGQKITSSQNKVKLTFRKDLSYCLPTFASGRVQCSIWAIYEYNGSVPLNVSGDAYLLADGKVYKALTPQYGGEFDYFDYIFSPGVRMQGGSSFDLPVGALIQQYFIGNSYKWRTATLSYPVNLYAMEDGLK